MRIPIEIDGKDWIITADENQYILAVEKKETSKGKEVIRLEKPSHFTSLGALFRCILNKQIMASDASTLRELVDIIGEYHRQTSMVFDKLVPLTRP